MNKRGLSALIIVAFLLVGIISFVKAQTPTQSLCMLQQGCSCMYDGSSCGDRIVGCQKVEADCIKPSAPAPKIIAEKTEAIEYNVVLIKDENYAEQLSKVSTEAATSAKGVSPKDIQVKVTCNYAGQMDKSIPDGSPGKCKLEQIEGKETSWNIGLGNSCVYPLTFEINIPKNKPNDAIITSCHGAALDGTDPSKACGFKFEGCQASSPGTSINFAAVLSKDGVINSLAWDKLFIFTLITGVLSTLLIVNKRRGTNRITKVNSAYRLHHLLNSNNYARSFK